MGEGGRVKAGEGGVEGPTSIRPKNDEDNDVDDERQKRRKRENLEDECGRSSQPSRFWVAGSQSRRAFRIKASSEMASSDWSGPMGRGLLQVVAASCCVCAHQRARE